jgi:hypothetical protein
VSNLKRDTNKEKPLHAVKDKINIGKNLLDADENRNFQKINRI